ncbi:MucB/RseB-like sigma(E) regulatory protein [Murinocardiopsis flavida]|uniref:MucB/RseB-like sigma(E) regulatory protein n=1 Tax=Murinocardiopsis flavida TaxID=645275 RepID=A0A2P8DJF7_9ACTN|nr:sigma-E factor regulatory protein RseB domain-containing protein [Murinocardiopsis flavida]PSK97355.1 MucB/RseB-like sigma(E) regulatory protein [Murinocardiopsis flavida]
MPDDARAIAVLCTLLLLLGLTSSVHPAAGVSGARDDTRAVDLLRRAVRAEAQLGYEGVQRLSFFNGQRTQSTTVEVAHQPGYGTVLDRPESGGGAGGLVVDAELPPGEAVDSAQPPLDLDDTLLTLLRGNYTIAAAGDAVVCGRDAGMVEARRSDGSAAGRFWIDDATGLLLRRETLDNEGRVAQSSVFVAIEMVERAGDESESAAAGPPSRMFAGSRRTEPWGDRLGAADRRRLDAAGWRLPERLAGRFSLVEARSRGAGAARAVHLTYSDGLSMLSVFVQPGRLRPTGTGSVAGLRAVAEDGATVYVGDAGQHRRMWGAGGFVYTVMADAPAESVEAASGSLPAPDGTGFWARIGRGFDRLGSWVGL